MTADERYDALRAHLGIVHHNLAAKTLDDREAVEQHMHEHYGPGGLRNHSHPSELEPIHPEPPGERDQPDRALRCPNCRDSYRGCNQSGCGQRRQPGWRDMTFLKVDEIARMMRISKMTVYRLVNSGELRATKIGRSFRIRQSAFDHYLERTY